MRFSPGVLIFGLLCSGPAFAQDMSLRDVLIDGEGWRQVAEGYKFTEGPAVDARGQVFFTDVPNSRIYKVDLDDKVSLFAENTANTNGLMFGPDGLLYGCQNGNKRIVTFDTEGRSTTIAENVNSNDLVVAGDGGVYFTDPGHKQVWYLSPKREEKPRVVAQGFVPNGIILWPDGRTLVVTDSTEPSLWTFRVEPDGNLSARDRYYGPISLAPRQVRPGSDGMTVDSAGRLYVATLAGLQVFDPTGRSVGAILRPQRQFLSNAVFGGPEFDTLYVTCFDKVYKRKTKCTGIRYGTPSKTAATAKPANPEKP